MNAKQQLEVIRRIAAEVVAELAPAEKRYFPVVWEEFLAREGATFPTGKPGTIAGFFYNDQPELKLVSALAICAITEVFVEMKQRFGTPEEQALREATIAAAQRMGAPNDLAQALGERIPGKFREAYQDAYMTAIAEPKRHPASQDQAGDRRVPECLVYVREPDKKLLQRYEGFQDQLQAQFTLQKSRFEIFVNESENVVAVAGFKESVQLEPRIRRLLIVLLLNRGKTLQASRLVKSAWHDDSPIIGADLKKVRSNLKVAISELKGKLKDFEPIQIPELPRDGDYCCQGEFTFCVLMSGRMDENLARLGLRPAFSSAKQSHAHPRCRDGG